MKTQLCTAAPKALPAIATALLCLAGAHAGIPVQITEFSTGLTAASSPYIITSGPDGNLWFTEFAARKIGKITTAGVIKEFNLFIPEIANGGQPSGITTGPDGNLWFTDFTMDAIGRITPAGAVNEFSYFGGLGTVGLGFAQITSGPDGNLWFTEYTAHAQYPTDGVGMITPAGSFLPDIRVPSGGESNNPPYYSAPLGITTGPDGSIWFTEYGAHRIEKYRAGVSVQEFSTSGAPGFITSGPDGNLWFTEDYGAIGRITPNGVVTEFTAGLSAGSNPQGITSGPDGNVWFTEFGTNKIGRITPAGVITEITIPTANSHPYGITLGPDGHIWFTEKTGNKIGRLTLAWTMGNTAVGNDHNTRILWTNPDGRALIWVVNSAGTTVATGSFGPIAGWKAQSISIDSTNNQLRLVWLKTDGTNAVWTLSSTLTVVSTFVY